MMSRIDPLLARIALRALWTGISFPGRWRVLRWTRKHSRMFYGFPARRICMGDFDFLVQPESNIDEFLDGVSRNTPIERIIRDHVRAGGVTLDIGANMGWTARLMSHLVGAHGTVHAFEPIPSAYDNLLLNVERAALKNIVVYPLAASDRCGTTQLFLSSRDVTALATMRPPNISKAGVAHEVDVVTIDSLLDRFPRVSFVKIDVEGAEFRVLAGMEQLIARDHPILAVELSDSWLRTLGRSAEQLMEFLRGYEYEVFRLNDGRYDKVTSPPAEQVDVLCLPAHGRSDYVIAAGRQ
jgi:FkbM family methyltransferase